MVCNFPDMEIFIILGFGNVNHIGLRGLLLSGRQKFLQDFRQVFLFIIANNQIYGSIFF